MNYVDVTLAGDLPKRQHASRRVRPVHRHLDSGNPGALKLFRQPAALRTDCGYLMTQAPEPLGEHNEVLLRA
jgi:hypothetical protein